MIESINNTAERLNFGSFIGQLALDDRGGLYRRLPVGNGECILFYAVKVVDEDVLLHVRYFETVPEVKDEFYRGVVRIDRMSLIVTEYDGRSPYDHNLQIPPWEQVFDYFFV
jgi:hypothetical protein